MATSSSETSPWSSAVRGLSKDDLPYLLPRVGIAIVFLGIGLWELVDPTYWAVYLPSMLSSQAWALRLVEVHGLVLTTTATAVLLPRYQRAGATMATLVLGEVCVDILLSNGVTGIFLRDAALLAVAAGLVWLPFPGRGAETGDD